MWRAILGLLLFLASWPLFSQESLPDVNLPPGWYLISEAQIQEIESELTKQERELMQLNEESKRADAALSVANNTVNELSIIIGQLETSLKRLERNALMWKWVAIPALIAAAVSTSIMLIR